MSAFLFGSVWKGSGGANYANKRICSEDNVSHGIVCIHFYQYCFSCVDSDFMLKWKGGSLLKIKHVCVCVCVL